MHVKGTVKRIRPKFTQIVSVPAELKKWAWDAVDNKIMLEVLVHRIMCDSTNYKALRLAFELWPDVCSHVINTYDDVFRGCRAAVKEWRKSLVSKNPAEKTVSPGT